jgi:hypothetical protein
MTTPMAPDASQNNHAARVLAHQRRTALVQGIRCA